MKEIFDMIADERRKLAGLVETLSDEQWHTPSALKGWSVRHVVAHLVWPLETTWPELFFQVARNGFHIGRTCDDVAASEQRSATELARRLRERAHVMFKPPGYGPDTPLAEILVHGLDIRWPLNIKRTIAPDRARIALDFLVTSKAIGSFVPRRLPPGLRFEATDQRWSHGTGPTVAGSSEELLLTLCGRSAPIEALEGDGVATLRERARR